jgi:hypothetical protein
MSIPMVTASRMLRRSIVLSSERLFLAPMQRSFVEEGNVNTLPRSVIVKNE